MLNCLWVGLGGFVGSVLRYLLSLAPVSRSTQFPVMTLIINVAGALAIGIIVGLSDKLNGISPNTLLLLKVGLCGGFTTFSTFALETTSLFGDGKAFMGIVYIVLSVVLCMLAVMLGKSLMKA